MALVILRDLSLGFTGPPLLDGVNLTIDPQERVCLVGRNGEGKSTLMRLIHGEIEPDSGEITRAQGLVTARLSQDLPKDFCQTIFDQVAAGLGRRGELLAEYHHLSQQLATEGGAVLERRLDQLGQALEVDGGWQGEREVQTVLSQMKLDPDAPVGELSVGMKRRVLLANALVRKPDILLLDEPTNHLDLEAITWLEEFLARYHAALLFVTHDRMFSRRLATRILDLDRGRLTSWRCDYDTFLKRREAALEAEATQQALFDKRLAREESWIRQGIKARRTRNEGRVRALVKMRHLRRQRRRRPATARIAVQEAERSGRLVIKASGVTFGYGRRPVVRDFWTIVMRSDRVGILGPNGSGKTTLLRLLLGDLQPQAGRVRRAAQLEVAYFDQLHAQLDEDKTVQENVAQGSDSVVVNGKKKHILGYLADFLFPAERARSLVRWLSGGERNRLLLARLFTKPSNLLVMDEPTNDLDAETLELLEERLIDYSGTILLVSHDREFLNNMVTSTLVFEGEGQLKEYAGNYDDWLSQQKPKTPAEPDRPAVKPKKLRPAANRVRRLTYHEKRELKTLPGAIETLEAEQDQLQQMMSDAEFYQQDRRQIVDVTDRLKAVEEKLAQTYQRWETLEELDG